MNSRHLRRIVHRMTMKDRRREKTIRRNRAERERIEKIRAENEAAIRANPDRYLNTIRMSAADIELAFCGNPPTGLAPRYSPPRSGLPSTEWRVFDAAAHDRLREMVARRRAGLPE